MRRKTPTTYPTDEAWSYFTSHLADIRSVVEMYLPSSRMEIPNTRARGVTEVRGVRQETRGSMPLAVRYTVSDFDEAVKKKDSQKLFDIMNDAWLRAPENRGVYKIPGFSAMCDLLDITVEGFIEVDDS